MRSWRQRGPWRRQSRVPFVGVRPVTRTARGAAGATAARGERAELRGEWSCCLSPPTSVCTPVKRAPVMVWATPVLHRSTCGRYLLMMLWCMHALLLDNATSGHAPRGATGLQRWQIQPKTVQSIHTHCAAAANEALQFREVRNEMILCLLFFYPRLQVARL